MKVLLLGFAFGFVFSFVSHAAGTTELHQNDALKQKAADLEVSLVADKHTYKPGDRIKLEVLLVNKNAVRDIFVYGTLQFGVRASFRLFRRDSKGKEVPTRFIDDAWELPPKSNDVSAFVKLLPFHFLGTTYRSSIHLLNMEKPGTYTMWVEYQCPISTAETTVSPFWGKENGIITSNVVDIEISP